MSITNVAAARATSPSTQTDTSTTGQVSNLGKDDFLMLLIAQLRNQDPLKPMEDREFITQLAQFNTLEQMQSMNATLSTLTEMTALGQTASFIGKQVIGLDRSTNETVTGIVSDVTILNGIAMLNVSGHRIDIRDVISVSAAPEVSEPEAATSSGAAG